ncbi:unnamed protein product, partial [Vitis vinifera]
MRSNPLVKKQIKKPIFRTAQEPVGSDFSSGATLATMGDVQNGFNATQAGGCERPSNVDGLIIESNPSQIDNNLEKAEELFSGKGLLSKFGRKPFVVDENRRATYSISNQPIVGSETIFNTFEAEAKQLVAVGLHADHSYARSLARFAATLGPVAWKVASQRIEQALPVGSKFGRGWVGEFEPLPTPVLMLETRIQKEPFLVPKLQHNAVLRKDEKISKPPVPAKEHSVSGPTLEGKQSLFCPASAPTTERKQPLFGSAGTKSTPPVNTVDSPPAMPSIPSPRSDSSNAAATAARAWMSIGAGGFKPVAENSITPKNHISADSLYNPTRELHPQVTRFRGEFPVSGGMHFQFQMQSPWQGLNPNTQPRHRQETLPPDLNIGFQPSGSPVRQSSGVLVDSQQPDLALQL